MAAITRIERGVRGRHRGRQRPAPIALLTLALALGSAVGAGAHDPGLSSIDIRVGSSEVAVVLSVAGADAEMVGGRSALGQVALESIDVLAEGARVRGSVKEVFVDEEGTVHARLIYRRPSGDRVVVRSRIPGQLGAGHRELATVRAEDGSTVVEQMLDANANEFVALVGPPTRASGLISARYDYLLLLAGLLVVARRWRRLLVASGAHASNRKQPLEGRSRIP
jgi:hypothetical protein